MQLDGLPLQVEVHLEEVVLEERKDVRAEVGVALKGALQVVRHFLDAGHCRPFRKVGCLDSTGPRNFELLQTLQVGLFNVEDHVDQFPVLLLRKVLVRKKLKGTANQHSSFCRGVEVQRKQRLIYWEVEVPTGEQGHGFGLRVFGGRG